MNQKYKITRDRLETLHVSQDHTPQEIAKYYGCSRSLIYHINYPASVLCQVHNIESL